MFLSINVKALATQLPALPDSILGVSVSRTECHEPRGSYSSVAEDSSLLGCDTVSLGKWLTTVQFLDSSTLKVILCNNGATRQTTQHNIPGDLVL
jgi:hypothetical protein